MRKIHDTEHTIHFHKHINYYSIQKKSSASNKELQNPPAQVLIASTIEKLARAFSSTALAIFQSTHDQLRNNPVRPFREPTNRNVQPLSGHTHDKHALYEDSTRAHVPRILPDKASGRYCVRSISKARSAETSRATGIRT